MRLEEVVNHGASKVSGLGHSILHTGRPSAILLISKKRYGHLAIHSRRRRRGGSFHHCVGKREAFEEAAISKSCDFFKLNTCCSIPTNCFKNAETIWGKACFVIPEYAFAVRVESTVLQLSHEHTEYNWLNYAEAHTRLQYDSNKTALWELNRRIALGMLN